jgi:hypothetical protein
MDFLIFHTFVEAESVSKKKKLFDLPLAVKYIENEAIWRS